MDNDLISRSELKKALCEFMKNNIGIYSNEMFHLVDSMPTVNIVNLEKQSFIEGFKEGCEHGKKCYEKPQGGCRTCIHRDPEDKKCDCGGLERQGCLFPVSDDYYCKYYEKGSTE